VHTSSYISEEAPLQGLTACSDHHLQLALRPLGGSNNNSRARFQVQSPECIYHIRPDMLILLFHSIRSSYPELLSSAFSYVSSFNFCNREAEFCSRFQRTFFLYHRPCLCVRARAEEAFAGMRAALNRQHSIP
jgi:hypothetical protein